jgi:NADPH:quinone reductase-like Zn-dependent oxidoreductase
MTKRWVATGFGDLDVLRFVDAAVPDPGPDEVTIRVRAAGMNPADYKRFAPGPNNDPSVLPWPIGFEVSGVIEALGPDTEIASGGGAVGDEVLAFRITGGYAEQVTVAAAGVFAKPPALDHPAAANLLLAGTTAAEMLHVTGVRAGDTVVVHGASGAVGVSVLQQAREIGVRCVGTASEHNFDRVRRFGGEPVVYGDGLTDRLRSAVPDGYRAALDTVGTDEAVDVSLELVADRRRIVTIAAQARAQRDGIQAIGGVMPTSAAFRDQVRPRLIAMAADGRLVVPVARTFALDAAPQALALLQTGHPGGKLALLPTQGS